MTVLTSRLASSDEVRPRAEASQPARSQLQTSRQQEQPEGSSLSVCPIDQQEQPGFHPTHRAEPTSRQPPAASLRERSNAHPPLLGTSCDTKRREPRGLAESRKAAPACAALPLLAEGDQPEVRILALGWLVSWVPHKDPAAAREMIPQMDEDSRELADPSARAIALACRAELIWRLFCQVGVRDHWSLGASGCCGLVGAAGRRARCRRRQSDDAGILVAPGPGFVLPASAV